MERFPPGAIERRTGRLRRARPRSSPRDWDLSFPVPGFGVSHSFESWPFARTRRRRASRSEPGIPQATEESVGVPKRIDCRCGVRSFLLPKFGHSISMTE
jgi:hypothetical protein